MTQPTPRAYKTLNLANNILDALPFDLHDSETTGFVTEPYSAITVRLNKWIQLNLTPSTLMLRLKGRVLGTKTRKAYKVSPGGSISAAFWTTVRDHTNHNISVDRQETYRKNRIKASWVLYVAYLEKLPGFTWSQMSARRIRDGSGEYLYATSKDNSVEIMFKYDVDANYVSIGRVTINSPRYLEPVEVSNLINIAGATTHDKPPCNTDNVDPPPGELFHPSLEEAPYSEPIDRDDIPF